MTSPQRTFLVVVFLGLALWRVFEIPGVATAFWAFCTIGAIPGTDKVLGTETLLRSLIAIFTVVVLLVFRKEFLAALPHDWQWPSFRSQQAVAVAPAAEPRMRTQPKEEQIVVVLGAQADRPGMSPFRPILMAAGMALAWTVHTLYRGEEAVRDVAVRLFRRIGQGLVWLYGHLRRFVLAAYSTLCTIVILASKLLRAAWKWCEPHFRTFDRHIETTLRSNKRTAKALNLLGEASKLTREVYQEAKHQPRK